MNGVQHLLHLLWPCSIHAAYVSLRQDAISGAKLIRMIGMYYYMNLPECPMSSGLKIHNCGLRAESRTHVYMCTLNRQLLNIPCSPVTEGIKQLAL